MLLIISWFVTAVAIAIDALRHPQHTKIMNVVWPITGLYLPIVGWWLYDNMGRPKSMYGRVITGRQRFLTIVFVSTTHCASGCVAGDIIGAPIVFAMGWTIWGERLYAEYAVLFTLAYCLGIAFQYFPIRATRKIEPRSAFAEAVKADTLALTAFEAGLFAWMGVVLFIMPRSELTSPLYWFMMQMGMVIGFITSLAAELASCSLGRGSSPCSTAWFRKRAVDTFGPSTLVSYASTNSLGLKLCCAKILVR